MRRVLALGGICSALACAAKEASQLPPAATPDSGVAPGEYFTWWQDVEPIVRPKCQLCHAAPPQFGAPRSYVEYADTQVVLGSGRAVHAEMVARIFASQNAMPPPSQPQLTDAEKHVIAVWSAIGAPEGTRPVRADAALPADDAGTPRADDAGTPPADDAGTPPADDAGTPPADASPTEGDASPTAGDATTAPSDGGTPAADAGGPPVMRRVEVRAHAPGSADPYALPVDRTNYVCWGFTLGPAANGATSEFAVRFEPLVDNTRHTHHMLLFRDRRAAAQDGPFACDGFPLDWEMVAGWAPGRMADDMPPGVGVPFAAGDKLVLQLHYDSVTAPGQLDRSGMAVVMTTQAGLTPAGMLWSGPVWTRALNGPNVSHENTCRINTPVRLFAAFPHMHQTGTRIKLEVRRSNAMNWTTLVDIFPWSFNDQPNVSITQPEQQIMPGDQLKTTCWWDTMGRSISYGEASNDEMCFNFIYHYPALSNRLLCVGVSL